MSYLSKLSPVAGTLNIADGLLNHLTGDTIDDVKLTYSHPNPIKHEVPRPNKQLFPLKVEDMRLPARINYPLIPYPSIIRDYIMTSNEKLTKTFHAHHHSHLKLISDTARLVFSGAEWKPNCLTFDIGKLKKLAGMKFSQRTEVIGLAASAYARRATGHDLSVGAMDQVNFSLKQNIISPYMSFLIMIQRLRVHIAMQKKGPISSYSTPWVNEDEARFDFYKNGTYSYASIMNSYRFALIAGGGHFRFFHSEIGEWFCGPMSYLDYAFTSADILNNIDVIRCGQEYHWADEFLQLITSTVTMDCEHNDMVNFMKILEGFMLNISDYDEAFAMNWRPLMEAIDELSKLDYKMTKQVYKVSDIAEMLHGDKSISIGQSLLKRIVACCLKLERRQVQELSSLHKFIFYAEVDSTAGVTKFLSRVHTDRPMDKGAIKNLTRLAKQLFFIAYHSRHQTPPNLRGNSNKIRLLEIYCNRNDIESIKAFPLSWWDDVIIYNCMDNTLTSDALEFAKDKGALKDEVHFGPGDSRKELLQVIEQPNYVLQDFF